MGEPPPALRWQPASLFYRFQSPGCNDWAGFTAWADCSDRQASLPLCRETLLVPLAQQIGGIFRPELVGLGRGFGQGTRDFHYWLGLILENSVQVAYNTS